MSKVLGLSIIATCFSLGFLGIGSWIIWDLVTTIRNDYVDPTKFALFSFPSPFFRHNWDVNTWTGVYDVGFTFIIVAAIINVIIFAYHTTKLYKARQPNEIK